MNLKQFAHAVYVATIRREPHADIYTLAGVALSFILPFLKFTRFRYKG